MIEKKEPERACRPHCPHTGDFVMNRFLFAVFSVFCLIGPASAAPDESPVEAAKKLISAWCRGDIETIKADCNPRHPFLEPGYDFKPLLDGIRHTGKYTGELEDLQVVRVGQVLDVITYRNNELVSNKALAN